MSGDLSVLLVGGPMYDPLYTRLAEFEEREDLRVETVVAPTHPDLNERIEAEFTSGGASYNLISTHTKYAPSQRQ
jgi:multiple sugar transport system substrate-binding protein